MNANSAKSNFGRKGWLVIIFVFFLYLFSATPPDTLNITVGFFANLIGVSAESLLVFSAIGGFAGIPVGILLGWVISKWGVKWPTFGVLVIYAVIWFVHGQVNSFVMYGVIVVLITAVSDSINLVCTQQMMNNWFPKKKGLALGWATMGMCVDSAVMVAVFQGLITGKGLSAPFNFMTIIALILALLTAFWFKAYPEQAGAYPDNEPLSEEEMQRNLDLINNYKSEWTFGKMLKCKQFWYLVIIYGFLFIGLVGIISQMIPRLISVGMEVNTAILWLTIASLIGIPASFIWGFIDQKFGTKRTVIVYCILWTVMMIVSALGSALVSIPVSIISIVFYACLLGGLGNLMPSQIIQVFGRYDFPQANRLASPMVVGIRSFALLIVPAMLAMAGDNNVGYRNVYIIFAILSLIATLFSILVTNKTIGKE